MRGIVELWGRLHASPSSGPGWKSQRIAEEAPCPLRVAVEEPSGKPAILCEVSATAVEAAVEYPEGRGFQLYPECVCPGPHGTVRLCMVLVDPAYREVFSILAEDIVDAVAKTADHVSAVRRLLSRLRAWQAFMRRGTTGLSSEEQTGLYAELLTLETLLACGLDVGAVVSGWTGAQSGLRDFLVGATEIEVKSGVGPHSSRFHVSHLDQLDETTIHSLLLFHFAFIDDPDGIALPEVVLRLKELIAEADPADASMFENLILAAGYANLDEGRYQRRLSVRKMRIFEVRGEFPRLLRREVRPGIVDAGYAVDLKACLPYEISNADAMIRINGRDFHA